MFNRKIRTKISQINPFWHTTKCKEIKDIVHPLLFDTVNKRVFSPGDEVWVRAHGHEVKWGPGRILARRGSVMYEVLTQGRSGNRHVDQLRKRHESAPIDEDDSHLYFEPQPPVEPTSCPNSMTSSPERRYPARIRRPPVRYPA